jgi:dolichol-phosphate mannosyltransferase
LSHFGNGFTKFFLKIHGIHTLSSFFRLFNYSSIQKLDAKYGSNIFSLNGFESVVEVLAKCTFLKIKISEVPMVVDWTKRKGKSKMKVIKTIIAYFNLYLHAKKIIFCDYVANKNS